MNEVLQDINVYSSMTDFLEDVVAVEDSGRPKRQDKAIRSLELHETTVRNFILQRLPPEQRTASGMGEAVPSDGGFLLLPQWSRQIIERSYQESAVLRRVTEWQVTDTNTNALKFPAIDETSRVDGQRFGGVRGYWANEADPATASKARFTNVELNPKKCFAVSYLTSELLSDMGTLSSYLFGRPSDPKNPGMAVLAKELSFRVTDAVINGDGAGKPQGVTGTPSTIVYATRTGGNAIGAQDVLNMLSRFWVGSRTDSVGHIVDGQFGPGPKPCWFCHSDAITMLATCVIAVGSGGSLAFLYNPETGIMMGIPVVPIEQCLAVGTAGDIMLTDFNEYHLAWRKRGVLDISMHVKFTTDEQAIRLVYRVDGNSGWNSAVTPQNGTATQSPFVTLHA